MPLSCPRKKPLDPSLRCSGIARRRRPKVVCPRCVRSEKRVSGKSFVLSACQTCPTFHRSSVFEALSRNSKAALAAAIFRKLDLCYRRESGMAKRKSNKQQGHGRTRWRSRSRKKHLIVSPMCPRPHSVPLSIGSGLPVCRF